MKKTYNKKANPARVEQFNAVDLDCSTTTVTGVRPHSEIQGLCDSLDKFITTLCERLDCLEVRLTPVLKADDDDDDVALETINWGMINKAACVDISSTPIGNQLKGYCTRLDSMVNGVNVLIDRLGV